MKRFRRIRGNFKSPTTHILFCLRMEFFPRLANRPDISGENGYRKPIQKRSPEWRVLKTPFCGTRVGLRKGGFRKHLRHSFEYSGCTSQRACSHKSCYSLSVTIAFSFGRAKTIKNCNPLTGPKNTDAAFRCALMARRATPCEWIPYLHTWDQCRNFL